MVYFESETDNMHAEDWKAMYLILFRGICDALELDGEEGAAAERLIRALQDAESYYIWMGQRDKKCPENGSVNRPKISEKNRKKVRNFS